MPTALIVDDEPEANELLAMLVQLKGYETVSAFNGREALDQVDRVRPELVFLDLMLPDINGYEVCRQLKSHRATCAIPIVMVTARLATENRIQGFRMGATDYVPKPYTPEQIFDAMAGTEIWRTGLDQSKSGGTVLLDTRSEVNNLRAISTLWTVLLQRTSLSEDAARELDHVLVELATRATDWGHRNGVGPVASLDYQWNSEGVMFTLRDHSGWFTAESSRGLEGPRAIVARAPFQESVRNERHDDVVFTLHFSPRS